MGSPGKFLYTDHFSIEEQTPLTGLKQKHSYDKRDWRGSISTFKTAQQDMSTDQMISGKSFSVAFVREQNRPNCRRSSISLISCMRSDHLEIFSLLFFVKVFLFNTV